MEHSEDMLIFDLLSMPIYHGWVVDPHDAEFARVLADRSYNALVEFIINARDHGQEQAADENKAKQRFDGVSRFLLFYV